MFRDWHITTPDAGINEQPYQPVAIPINGLVKKLEPFHFVVLEAYDGEFANNQVVLATTTYPYFPNGKQVTIYALNQDGRPGPTAIKVDHFNQFQPAFYPETFGAFMRLVGKWIDHVQPSEGNIVLGFNIASFNHLAHQIPYPQFLDHPIRRTLAQSVPIFHGQLLEIPRGQHGLYYDLGPNLTETKHIEALGGKLVREYQMPDLSEDELRTRIEAFMNMWLCEQQNWNQWGLYREAFYQAVVNNPHFYHIKRSTVERLPQYYDIPPYGFEICTQWQSFNQLIANGTIVGDLLYEFEAAVAQKIGFTQHNGNNALPGYNYNCIFFFEGGLLKCVFAPHSIRTGLMESMGFIVHRPSRKNT